MDTLKTMRRRIVFQLQDADGKPVEHSSYEAAILAAAQTAIPGEEVTFRDKDILIDVLSKEETLALKNAIAASPELKGHMLERVNLVFCEMDGTPIHGKDRFYELVIGKNRLSREAFGAKYGPDADPDEIED